MFKMDKIWIAAASLIYPNVAADITVTRSQIQEKVGKLFGEQVTPIMISRHLVSWEDRDADPTNPRRGGSRNRYLFRTSDGITPSPNGDFRLYKAIDSKFDGKQKTGRICPNTSDIPTSFHDLIDWYKSNYY